MLKLSVGLCLLAMLASASLGMQVGPVARYDFSEGHGQRAGDGSGNGHDGAIYARALLASEIKAAYGLDKPRYSEPLDLAPRPVLTVPKPAKRGTCVDLGARLEPFVDDWLLDGMVGVDMLSEQRFARTASHLSRQRTKPASSRPGPSHSPEGDSV